MRVFMLGWEFPPYISGGLGTACLGLTKALARRGSQISFVLPQPVHAQSHSPVELLPSAGPPPAAAPPKIDGVSFHVLPTPLSSPYTRASDHRPQPNAQQAQTPAPVSFMHGGPSHGGVVYTGDLVTQADRYAQLCLGLSRRRTFDVVHAHDWLTFPAGLAVAAASGKPLVVHVHSTEFDRSGDAANTRICEIERRGMKGACRVIAVSHLTRQTIHCRYGIDPRRIDVVYNGVDCEPGDNACHIGRAAIRQGDKVVLFLGRMTMQKGPEYFVAAAGKVLQRYQQVKFVMAGTGDMMGRMIELAAREGIGHKVLFTGFLDAADVARVFEMADVYVMPSVSEPFGITPLEAISHDVPVIISKTSGVSEVLQHALKVDFWDTHAIADRILALLRHPPLGQTMRRHADIEVRRLTWDEAADRTMAVYARAKAMVER
jgi:glycogen synthase